MTLLTDTQRQYLICLLQTETGLENMIMEWIKNLTVDLFMDDVL